MKNGKIFTLAALVAAFAFAGQASAIGTDVSGNASGQITASQTWTKANSPYFLKEAVKFVNGADLTIEAGVTVITLLADDGGIVITRGSKIFVNGTADEPVIMTSAADVATWSGSTFTGPATGPTAITNVGDRTTGTWRAVDSEWRNLTILGEALISASEFDINGDGSPQPVLNPITGTANVAAPSLSAPAQKIMEGLDLGDGTAAEVSYGGTNDNDDSGTISYLSSRYTGRVLGTGDELNGISLGAIGRETDISHLDLMNNVDDGVEMWGGTMEIKYVNVWNIGDDSFDFDQGWRGKAQFGLLVQGYASANAPKQGSGAGDNIFEHDGAEQSDAQPRTTATIYNFTAIGEPNSGDGATTWRDNARVQYRNCIFMDVGEELVRLDGDDGDGGQGYGFNGTHQFTAIWTTDYTVTPTINLGTDFTAADLYKTQQSGKLAEIKNSVFFNLADDGDDQAYSLGILNGSSSNPQSNLALNNYVVDSLPIKARTRAAAISIDGKNYERVATLDPRPVVNEATVSAADPADPSEGFWSAANYPGAFSWSKNWALGWTAADAFGFFVGDDNPATELPNESIALRAGITFPSEIGVTYIIYASTDGGATFDPILNVTATDTTTTVADPAGFSATKLYDVRVE